MSITSTQAETLLATLERNRPRYQFEGERRLDDLTKRLGETISWCTANLDLAAVGSCLRPRSLAPQSLPADRWHSIDDVIGMRRQALQGVQANMSALSTGRFLVYYPDADLTDGAAEVASQEFFDVYNAPPWGTWVGYFEDQQGAEHYRSYVVAWVPQGLIPMASAGVEVNPEACIVWLDQTAAGIRPIIELLAVGT